MATSDRMRRMARAALIALGSALLAACATSGSGGAAGGVPASDDVAANSSSRNVLTAEQLGNTAASNVYDAIRTLRPELLTGRGLGAPDVYIRGARETRGLDRLKEIPVTQVDRVEYLRLEAARDLAGQQSQGGALVLTLK